MLPAATQLAEACGARLVYDSHELYSEQEFSVREKRRWAEIEAKYIGACDVLIAVNQSIATELEQRYGVSGVRVIYNAERTRQAPAVTRKLHQTFGLPADKKIVLLQGGLSAGHNLEVLVDAMRYVQNPSVVLVVLGDGLWSENDTARGPDGPGLFSFCGTTIRIADTDCRCRCRGYSLSGHLPEQSLLHAEHVV